MYYLAIIHKDRESLAREIGVAAQRAAAAVLGDANLLTHVINPIAIPAASVKNPVAMVYLASKAGASDPTIDAALTTAFRNGIAVLPVFQST